MAEPELPVWLITLFGWSDSWWYSVIRMAVAITGGILFIAGVLIAFGQFFRGMLMAALGAVLGPHLGLIIPTYWPVPDCAGWAIALGRAWAAGSCDLYSGASANYLLSRDSLAAQQRTAEIQSSWPYNVVAWLVFLWGAWLISSPLRRRLVNWWTQRRNG